MANIKVSKNFWLTVGWLVFSYTISLAQSAPDKLIFNNYESSGVPVFTTLDPADSVSESAAEFTFFSNIYETLFTYEGVSVSDFEPLLATDYTVSEDGTLYTYTLREGVKFHSGNSFSCKDVEYTFQRLLVIYRGLTWFLGISFFGQDYGNADGYVSALADEAGVDTSAEDWDPRAWEGAEAAYADYWQQVDDAVVCVDDYTVQFKLSKPDSSFFIKLLTPVASILDSEWAKANGEWDGTEATYLDWIDADTSQGYLANNASGSGAYQLVSWAERTAFADAFPEYWGGVPPLKTVQYTLNSDLDATLLSLQNADADIISIAGTPNESAVLEAKLQGSPGVLIQETTPETAVPAAATDVVIFNHNINMEGNEFVASGQLDGEGIPADFFSDINVRRGFLYSYDPEESMAVEAPGTRYQPTMAIPTFVPGYDPSLPVYTYDPEKAEEAFRAAFGGELWEKGFSLDLVYYEPLVDLDILKANVEDLNPNFRVNIVTVSSDEYYTLRGDGKLPLGVIAWALDYPSAGSLLYDLYYTGDSGNPNGFSNYVDEDLNALVDAAVKTTDADEAAQLWGQVGRYAYDNALTILHPSRTGAGIAHVTRDNIQGLYDNPMISGDFFWKDISKN
jgi:peptide/nickel transport system substrate-binding protein